MPNLTLSKTHIWQLTSWPAMHFDPARLAPELQAARLAQGQLLGQLEAIGLEEARGLGRDLWIQEAIATAAIEGERLDLSAVRSSVTRRLGLADLSTYDRHVDGLVEVMQDATANHDAALDEDRLCRWQSALFPGGTAGIRRIAIGRFRDHAEPMQIVSGLPGREVVHYTAPASSEVRSHMRLFLQWFNGTRPGHARAPFPPLDGLVRAALAHLWFETVHPFEDGNGRLGRAIADMAIAQDLNSPTRVFSLSRQLLDTRAGYYDALQHAQSGELDVTPWVEWFIRALTQGCHKSRAVVRQAISKSALRTRCAALAVNERQRKILERLMEAGDGGFLGGMTADKYSKITGASKATATRDLADLLQKDLLLVEGVGKATRYVVNV
ncbi:MAG: Fic family protein, partial [Bdellovibrionales bacterium]|nr:Fic family protein [Ramlibacter sp.]